MASILDLMMQQEAMTALQNLNKPSSAGLLGQPQTALQAGLLGGMKGIAPYTGYTTVPTTFGQAITGAITGAGGGVQDYETAQSKKNLERLTTLSTVKDIFEAEPSSYVTVASVSDPSTPIFVKKGEEGLTDQSGNPLYVPYQKPEYKQNFAITQNSDGTFKVTSLWEDPSKESGVSDNIVEKKVVQDFQTKLSQSLEQGDKLFGLYEKFDPSYLTYGGKLSAYALSLKDKLNAGSLSLEEAQFLKDYSAFTQDAAEGLNKYIKDITGAQMSEAEAQRLKQGYPNLDDSPTQFESKLNNLTLNNTLSIARTNFFLKNQEMFTAQGIDSNNPYAVDADGKTIPNQKNLSDIVTLNVNDPYSEKVGSIQEIIIETAENNYKKLIKDYPSEDPQKIMKFAIEETSRYFGVNLENFLEPK